MPEAQLNRTFTFVLSDQLLLMCDKPSRVTEALEDTVAGRKPALDDALLADLLKKVDRRQSIWGAASLKKLSPIPKLKLATVETLLRPILQNADAVYGGFQCGDDITGTIYLVASSDEKAGQRCWRRSFAEDTESSRPGPVRLPRFWALLPELHRW